MSTPLARLMAVSAGVVSAAALAAAGACSSGGSAATGPSDPPTATTTITLTSSGVSPHSIQVSPGSQVTFINNDSRPHDMESDPHPEHTDCPELSQVGFLSPGQSRRSGNLNTVRTCGYHDHDDAGNTRFQGSIVIR
jgi:plastocyanin